MPEQIDLDLPGGVTAEAETETDILLTVATRKLVGGVSYPDFVHWMQDFGAEIAPRLMGAGGDDVSARRALLHMLARVLWAKTPIPDLAFRPRPLPEIGRNEPCPCGSGRKFKHCCAPMQNHVPPLERMSLLHYVLADIPTRNLAKLPRQYLAPDELAAVAHDWLQEGEAARAEKLLAPVFAEGAAALDARAESAFDVLLDVYDALGRPRKKEHLLQMLLAAPDRRLRSSAQQRLATILFDQGRYAEAWRYFSEAQRSDPDSPSLAHLEVLLLMAQGDRERALERARFWVARLTRAGDEASAGVAGFLRDFIAAPETALMGAVQSMVPGVEQLVELLRNLPAPALHYSFQRFSDEYGEAAQLEAEAPLRALEQEWSDVFPRSTPMLTALSTPSSAWEAPQRWLDWLRRQPAAFDSFAVLDDLVNATSILPALGDEIHLHLRRPLLERGVALLRIAHAQAGDVAFPWACLENRPALRLLANLIADLEGGSQADRDRRFELLGWIVGRLNPNDNHGFREELVGAQLERGLVDAALDVCARYPDDAGALACHRVLALFLAGRHDEAAAALARARKNTPKILAALKRERMRAPKLQPGMMTLGGDDEAWYYREDYRPLWERTGALAWLGAR